MQPFFRSRAKSGIHPIAWLAFLDPGKAHALNLELFANEGVQINTGDEYVTACRSWLSLRKVQFTAERVEVFPSEEGNLAFVVLPVVKESVAADTATSNAIDSAHLYGWFPASSLAVMAKILMRVRDIKVQDLPPLAASDFICIALDRCSQGCVG